MQTQNTPSALRNRYYQHKAAIEAWDLFLTIYESKLPEGLGHVVLIDGTIQYVVALSYASSTDHARALLEIGRVFGRDSWISEPDYSNKNFDWKKEITLTSPELMQTVKLCIYGAQKIDQPQSFPVEPKCFPLQLEEGGE